MIRRTFFEILSGIALPRHDRPVKMPPAPRLSAADPEFGALCDAADPEWLAEWLRLPRLPLLAEDVTQIAPRTFRLDRMNIEIRNSN